MLKLAVLVSGGGTNLQAIMDGIASGSITNAKIVTVISNNKNAYALDPGRAGGDSGVVHQARRTMPTVRHFTKHFLRHWWSQKRILIVLAGCLVVIPPK